MRDALSAKPTLDLKDKRRIKKLMKTNMCSALTQLIIIILPHTKQKTKG